MKSCETGVEPLYRLAEQLVAARLPLDVVELEIGEKPVPRTDLTQIRSLLEIYESADLVIPLGGDSGLVALEVDEVNGGTESLRILMTKVEIPRTPIVKTADGPTYILMRTHDKPGVSRKGLKSGLALMANETCIIVPPKDDTDRSQGWWKHFPGDAEVAPIPDKLAALL